MCAQALPPCVTPRHVAAALPPALHVMPPTLSSELYVVMCSTAQSCVALCALPQANTLSRSQVHVCGRRPLLLLLSAIRVNNMSDEQVGHIKRGIAAQVISCARCVDVCMHVSVAICHSKRQLLPASADV